MAELVSSIRQSVIPRVGQELAKSGGVRQWFVEGTYSASYDQSLDKVTIDNIVTNDLIDYLNYDYQRFALSSWESFYSSSLESEHLRFVSWPMLKLYYSAFFAAHAILRSLGASFVKIEKDQIDTINLIVRASDTSAPLLKPGMFKSEIYQTVPGKIGMALQSHNDGSGVHEGFWRTFADILDSKAAHAVAANNVDANLFVAGMNELGPRLRGWLSTRRNEINYQHLYGLWYPVDRARQASEYIKAIKPIPSSSVNLSESMHKEPMVAFRSTCQFLSCLNQEIAEFIAARSPGSRGFGARWRKFNAMYTKFNSAI